MLRITIAALMGLALADPVSAQVRVTPQSAQGGQAQGEPWAEVPETFRHLKTLPEWPLPTDRGQWERVDRPKDRATLIKLLGALPPRPDPAKVEVISREERDGYTLERFQFHNGADQVVPGLLLLPEGRKGPVPVVVGLHGHSSNKENLLINESSSELIGPALVKKGYAVAAIDSYFCGERFGKGPAGKLDANRRGEEESLMKLNLLLGRTLWGMMVRDEQCLLDYLQTRPEIDQAQIGVTGMSMGCTRSWWLAAIDDRPRAVVGIACFTRYNELIAHGNLRNHGVYYFVPGVLAHFDTEAIYAQVAPRPMLMLSGDQDGGAPTDGIIVLEEKLAAVYALCGKPEDFRSVVYAKTGHEYLPEMKAEMLAWFEKHLPAGDSKTGGAR